MNAEQKPAVKYFVTAGLAAIEGLRIDNALAVGCTIARKYSDGRYFLTRGREENGGVKFLRIDGSVQ